MTADPTGTPGSGERPTTPDVPIPKAVKRRALGQFAYSAGLYLAGIAVDAVAIELDTPVLLRVLAPVTILVGVVAVASADKPFHRDRLREARWKLWAAWAAAAALVLVYLGLTTRSSRHEGLWIAILTAACLAVAATISLRTVLTPHPSLRQTLESLATLLVGVAILVGGDKVMAGGDQLLGIATLLGAIAILTSGKLLGGVATLLGGVATLLGGIAFVADGNRLLGIATLLVGAALLLGGAASLTAHDRARLWMRRALRRTHATVRRTDDPAR